MSKERVINLIKIKSQPALQRGYKEMIRRAKEEEEREKWEEEEKYRKNNQLLSRSGAKEIFQAINEEFLGGKGNISQRDFSSAGHEVRVEYMQGSEGTGEYTRSHPLSEVSLKWKRVREIGPQKVEVEVEIRVEAEDARIVRVEASFDPRDLLIYYEGELRGYKPTTAQIIGEIFTWGKIQFKSLRSVTEEVIADMIDWNYESQFQKD